MLDALSDTFPVIYDIQSPILFLQLFGVSIGERQMI